MDVGAGQNAGRLAPVDPAERSAALANARHRASEQAVAEAKLGEARRAEQLAQARNAIQRAVGANTDLSISRNDQIGTYIYRAIDRATGEVIREWPPVQFAQFLHENGVTDLTRDALAGMMVNEEA